MAVDLLIIDLDNTLYRADSGVFQRMDQRMNAYIREHTGVSPVEADSLRLAYWRRYGTTLRGLMLHHAVDAEDFLHYVHDVQAHELLIADAGLDRVLQQMPGRKVIHTNGTREHAETILACLAIRKHFSAIYDIRFNQYQPKPCAHTLNLLLQQEQANPQCSWVIDDMSNNLEVARQLGLKTCWVDPAASESHEWDVSVTDFYALLHQRFDVCCGG